MTAAMLRAELDGRHGCGGSAFNGRAGSVADSVTVAPTADQETTEPREIPSSILTRAPAQPQDEATALPAVSTTSARTLRGTMGPSGGGATSWAQGSRTSRKHRLLPRWRACSISTDPLPRPAG